MDSHSNLQVPNCGPLTAFWPCASSDSLWSWQFEQSPSILLQFERKGAANRPQPTPYQFCGLSPRRRQLPDRIADFPSEANTVNSRVFLMQELPLMLLQHKMPKSWIKITWFGSLVLVWRCWFFWFELHPWPPLPFTFDVSKIFPKAKAFDSEQLTNWPSPREMPCRAVTLAQPRGSNLSSTSAVASTMLQSRRRTPGLLRLLGHTDLWNLVADVKFSVFAKLPKKGIAFGAAQTLPMVL